MLKKPSRKELQERRHRRIRRKLFGTSQRPRLCVYKSLRHIHAQLVDDTAGHTLISASTLQLKGTAKCNASSAKLLGKLIAQRALEKGIKRVVFDRSGYPYHGVIKALAESSREAGLEF